MTFDQNMQQVALKLIIKRGKTVIYSSVATGTYNPATSTVSTTTTPYTIKAIVQDASSTDLETGTLVNIGNKVMTISALSLPVAPTTNDIVTLDGLTYLVFAANPVYAGELPATYKIRMRRQ